MTGFPLPNSTLPTQVKSQAAQTNWRHGPIWLRFTGFYQSRRSVRCLCVGGRDGRCGYV